MSKHLKSIASTSPSDSSRKSRYPNIIIISELDSLSAAPGVPSPKDSEDEIRSFISDSSSEESLDQETIEIQNMTNILKVGIKNQLQRYKNSKKTYREQNQCLRLKRKGLNRELGHIKHCMDKLIQETEETCKYIAETRIDKEKYDEGRTSCDEFVLEGIKKLSHDIEGIKEKFTRVEMLEKAVKTNFQEALTIESERVVSSCRCAVF